MSLRLVLFSLLALSWRAGAETPQWLVEEVQQAAARELPRYLKRCGDRHFHHDPGVAGAPLLELMDPSLSIGEISRRALPGQDEDALDAPLTLSAIAIRSRPAGPVAEGATLWRDWRRFEPAHYRLHRRAGRWAMLAVGTHPDGLGRPTGLIPCDQVDLDTLFDPLSSRSAAGPGATAVLAPVEVPEAVPELPPPPSPEVAEPAPPGTREAAELRHTMQVHSWRLYAPYDRKLRTAPELRGQVVFRITVAADGAVTAVQLVSSELGDAGLEAALLEAIRSIDFGARHVRPITFDYPVQLEPS